MVLCHMDPSGEDLAYQRAVADRGVWLEFDMIGMPFFFAGEGQSPAPEQTAAAIGALVVDGYGDQLLLSHDMALKSMWTRNGGTASVTYPVCSCRAYGGMVCRPRSPTGC